MPDFRLDRFSADEANAIAGANGQKFKRRLDKAFTKIEDQINEILDVRATALERMGDFAPLTITADYTGTIDPPSQLPKIIQAHRYNDTADVTDECDWSATLVSGDADISINAATGVVTVNDISVNSVVNVTSARGVGGTIIKPLSLYFTTAAASTGGGGTSDIATDTTFASFNSTTHSPVSSELTVIVGTGGVVDMAAPLTLTTGGAPPDSTYGGRLRWQWWDGATWIDQGSEGLGAADVAEGSVSNGSITANAQKTGLTPSASEKFRLTARTEAGTRAMYLYGTASVVAS